MSIDHAFFQQTAWVTGASRGLGRATALRFAREGAVVCAGARTLDELHQVSRIADSNHDKIHPIYLDVADPASVASFRDEALNQAGAPSILVNNAGYGLFQDVEVMTPEEFSRQVDVNLKGPWYMAKAALMHMRQLGGGHIINISSIAGRAPFKRGSAYNAAKAGLNLMSESLMLELREYNIKVTVVAPGSIDTRFHSDSLPAANQKDQSWMLEPETIADSLVHLLTQPDNTLTNYYELRPLNPGKK